jgi:hypothetical protein
VGTKSHSFQFYTKKKATLPIQAVGYSKIGTVTFLRGCLLNITKFSTTKKDLLVVITPPT